LFAKTKAIKLFLILIDDSIGTETLDGHYQRDDMERQKEIRDLETGQSGEIRSQWTEINE